MFEQRNLYRAIAELAFAIAKADGSLQVEEKAAFHTIIKKELGLESWAAESRFDILDEVVNPKMEESYNQALSILRRNKKYVTEDMKKQFIRVIEEVAKAYRGEDLKESQFIQKFQFDIKNL